MSTDIDNGQTDSDNGQIVIEIYKVHAELAEQVAGHREGLHKLYSGMVAIIVSASIFMERFVPETQMTWVLPVLGLVISISWLLSIYSITARLAAKHDVLVELEKRLPFDFFVREESAFRQRGSLARKRSSLIMPWCFVVMCTLWTAYLFCFSPTVKCGEMQEMAKPICIDAPDG